MNEVPIPGVSEENQRARARRIAQETNDGLVGATLQADAEMIGEIHLMLRRLVRASSPAAEAGVSFSQMLSILNASEPGENPVFIRIDEKRVARLGTLNQVKAIVRQALITMPLDPDQRMAIQAIQAEQNRKERQAFADQVRAETLERVRLISSVNLVLKDVVNDILALMPAQHPVEEGAIHAPG